MYFKVNAVGFDRYFVDLACPTAIEIFVISGMKGTV